MNQEKFDGEFEKGDLVRCLAEVRLDPHWSPEFTVGRVYEVHYSQHLENDTPGSGHFVKSNDGAEVYINHREIWPHFDYADGRAQGSMKPKPTKKEIAMEAFGFQSEAELEEFLKQ